MATCVPLCEVCAVFTDRVKKQQQVRSRIWSKLMFAKAVCDNFRPRVRRVFHGIMQDIRITCMFVEFSFLYFFSNFFSSYEHFSGETLRLRNPTRGARADTLVEARARSVPSGGRGKPSMFFCWAGVCKAISLVSLRKAFQLLSASPPYSFPWEHSPDIHIPGTQQTNCRAQPYNVAAHTPCVCDTPICTEWCGWLYLSEPAVRSPPFTPLRCCSLCEIQTHAHSGRKCEDHLD